jgi:hypothetical protein
MFWITNGKEGYYEKPDLKTLSLLTSLLYHLDVCITDQFGGTGINKAR